MHKSEKIICIIALIAILIITAFGVTYAYILPRLTGGETTNTIKITSAEDLSLQFRDGRDDITSTNIAPGWSKSKYFTIVNDTDVTIKYDLNFTNVDNQLVNKEYLRYDITCASAGVSITDKQVPDEDSSIVTGITILSEEEHEYTVTVTYLNDSDHNQIDDLGKTFSLTIEAN